MANRPPTPPYSESLLSDYKTPTVNAKTGKLTEKTIKFKISFYKKFPRRQ